MRIINSIFKKTPVSEIPKDPLEREKSFNPLQDIRFAKDPNVITDVLTECEGKGVVESLAKRNRALLNKDGEPATKTEIKAAKLA
ncbi:hypothetical protein ISS03_05040 [Patescibacteria group bacterium]|nr:hypothetical protein [Patescibacteria group bacterium]